MIPFQFKKDIKAAGKNKCILEENNSNTDLKSNEEDKEGLQSSDGSQAQGNGDFPGEVGGNSSNEHTLLR